MLLKKRLINIFMATILIVATALNVSALRISDDLPISMYNRIGIVSPLDNDFPAEYWNVSTAGDYSINGSGQGSAEIYTLYRLKSDSGEINYTIYNNNNTKPMDVYYYKNGLTLLHRHKLCTINAGESASGTIKVSSSGYIVFAFIPPCNMTGTVTE